MYAIKLTVSLAKLHLLRHYDINYYRFEGKRSHGSTIKRWTNRETFESDTRKAKEKPCAREKVMKMERDGEK